MLLAILLRAYVSVRIRKFSRLGPFAKGGGTSESPICFTKQTKGVRVEETYLWAKYPLVHDVYETSWVDGVRGVSYELGKC